ncbi:MAG: hypothetical protein AB1428_10815 [Bacteroidota bacterium]
MKYHVRWSLVLTAAAVVGSAPRLRAIDDKTRDEIQAVKDYVRLMQSRVPAASADVTTGTVRKDDPGIAKTAAMQDRKSYFMNGNKIATEVYNYGGIAPGYGLLRGVNNVVWRNVSYVFQFCPIVGTSVPDARNPGRRIHIISDGLNDYPQQGLREVSPTGDTLWQWQPLAGYADPSQKHMASNPAPDEDRDGKPDSWPRTWYNPTLGKYVWPGYLSQDATSADLEVFWAMDDRENAEFEYYPFPGDSSRKGIGLQVDGRGFQWSNALAENTIFFVYTITNVSDKDLDTVFFGIYGDADVGGGSPENVDDNGFFIPPYDSTGAVEKIPVYSRSLVYFWDPDMREGRGLPVGYIGCKFLESPGNPNDGIDNDGDGVVDERQDDGIDNDTDWNPIGDDLGIDGVANTGDPGEGDGVPTAGRKLPDGSLDPLYPGEPNFELTDLDESDQIGLTSFNSWTWPNDRISDDESMWRRCIPRNFGSIQQNSDIVFIFGSGYISLKKGETKRISMALILGESLDDLLTSAKTVQTIYNQNYRFFKPPITPQMTAVPGDRKVNLYWDTRAEESVDPITGKDFEGYVIYRSTDPSFNDIQTVTDGRGAQFLLQPLKDVSGVEAKFDVAFRDEPFTDLNRNGTRDAGEPFVDLNKDGIYSTHIEDIWRGYHPVPYQDRGVQYYLGNNRGLVHSYLDLNNVINGQTYYYAVVAYDHGDSVGIPPTETTKKITVDPITSELVFDVNTAQVIPGPRASGYVPPAVSSDNVTHAGGFGTGDVLFEILNDLTVQEGGEYELIFGDSVNLGQYKIPAKNYSVLDRRVHTVTVTLFDTNFASLGRSNVADDAELKVTDNSGVQFVRGQDYQINFLQGSVRRTGTSRIPNNASVSVSFRSYPIRESTRLKGEDDNPTFDGIRLRVIDEDSLKYDPARSGWVQGKSNLDFTAFPSFVSTRKIRYPADYEIEFASTDIDTALTRDVTLKRVPVKYTVRDVTTGVPRRVATFLGELNRSRNAQWDPGEEIAFFKTGNAGTASDTITWGVVVSEPLDTTITPILPGDGDVLRISTMRLFDARDRFLLTTSAGTVNRAIAAGRMDKIYVVPNPYIAVNEIEPANRLPGQTRGERRIYFENLPQRCTIRIFTLNGDLVATLNHDAAVDNGREFWNLLNRDGFSVSYGIYVAHVDAPDIGEKLLKFALIK